ncbi:MAG TPA: hypothetical protein VMT64_15995 [Candidatus Binataceae bacterium]|nr:hypothetical protein [Candidatus Binataceae bacterium]
MSDATHEAMLRRIERLERSNRALKFVVLGALVVSVALNAFPAMSSVFPHGPKQTDAQRFNLVSPKGVLLATLGQTANGGYLSFYDAKGHLEMNLGAGAPDANHPTNTSVGLAIYDGNALLPSDGTGVARIVMAGNATAGNPTVFGQSIFDSSATLRASFATGGDGANGGSFFYDGNQTLRAGIGAGNSGPGAFFNDSTGTTRLSQGVSANDAVVSLAMFSTGATDALYSLSAVGNGSATTFQIEDGSGTPRLIEGFSSVSNEIVQLNNAAGTETFRAPCTNTECP